MTSADDAAAPAGPAATPAAAPASGSAGETAPAEVPVEGSPGSSVDAEPNAPSPEPARADLLGPEAVAVGGGEPEAARSAPSPESSPEPSPERALAVETPAQARMSDDGDGDSDPASFGRVDADGAVWVRTAAGERQVGSWLAGNPADGLAYFVRRYQGLEAEVALLQSRVASGKVDAAHAREALSKLQDQVAHASAVGDLDGLEARLAALGTQIEAAAGRASAARAEHRERLAARKRELVGEAESLAESTDWKSAGDRLRAIGEEFRGIHGVDRATDSALWKRYAVARDTFSRRRGAHFAELDRKRDAARVRKEEIVAEAESLSGSTEWGPTASRMKELMAEWKSAGPAARDVESALWAQFRAAQDAFFTRRSEVFADRDASLRENLARKEALLAEAEAIDPADPAAQRRLRDILERWDRIGHVPREALARVDGRLRAVQQRIQHAAEAAWRRSSPEAVARAEATVSQLRDSITRLENDAVRARQQGRDAAAAEADRAATARRAWLAEAERTLADLRGA